MRQHDNATAGLKRIEPGDDQLIPIFSVSPTHITAQIPRASRTGRHVLRIVRRASPNGLPASWYSANYRVENVALGIFGDENTGFFKRSDSTPYLNEDGKRAKSGDIMVAQLTGLGLTQTSLEDGYPAPQQQIPSFRDVRVLLSISQSPDWTEYVPIKPMYVGALSGAVGVDQVIFKVPSEFPYTRNGNLIRVCAKDDLFSLDHCSPWVHAPIEPPQF